jgi:putative ABC transport system permease protein
MLARWLEWLIADAVFGARQLAKHKVASFAAILSLALGIGASMAAFRLIDALFLRPLPVADPAHLYALTYPTLFEAEIGTNDRFTYPAFRELRASVQNEADLMAISVTLLMDATFGDDEQTERVWRQYVPGSMFREFGLKPALGRLFNEADDLTPGAHPYAVISYDYWSRRFGKDPNILGLKFRTGDDIFEIIGVAPETFTGTDPGTFTDMFVPNMMNVVNLNSEIWNGYRVWLRPRSGAGTRRIQRRLTAALHAYRQEDVKTWAAARRKDERDFYLAASISLAPASGRSPTQHGYQRALEILAVLVGLVLLIACANVANLMTAQAAVRAREMALRISIGAARMRLVQLLLVESALIAIAASTLGLALSWWAAPFVVHKLRMGDQPIRLVLHADWRVTLFALALTFTVTMLFGLAPALRASSVTPAAALKGGDDPHGRRRLMNSLTAAQATFCTFVLFVGGLFIATFERMANQPTGFSSARVLTLESVSKADLSRGQWYQATQQIRTLPGVESAALAQYALMSFNAQTGFIWANGHAPDGTWSNSTWFLGVSPGWFETMKLDLLAGRDFRWDDQFPKVAIVNEKFSHRYFGSESPIGRTFETLSGGGFAGSPGRNGRVPIEIIGVVRDARYEDMRLPVPATAYVPFRTLNSRYGQGFRATFLVRTKPSDPMSLAPMLRREITAARPEIRIATIVSQEELVRSQMVRERLLAALAFFFVVVALALAAVGLYGVLNYAVLERRRELGIRIALGAPSADIASRVTLSSFTMIAIGSTIGIVLGLDSQHYIASLLYQVKATDPNMMALPILFLLGTAALVTVPPVLRALRIDPAALLRSE